MAPKCDLIYAHDMDVNMGQSEESSQAETISQEVHKTLQKLGFRSATLQLSS